MYDCLSAGLEPTFTILEVVATEEESLASESAWVAKLAAEGHPLLNRWKEHRALISSSATRREAGVGCANHKTIMKTNADDLAAVSIVPLVLAAAKDTHHVPTTRNHRD
jgi:hypothetical protein